MNVNHTKSSYLELFGSQTASISYDNDKHGLTQNQSWQQAVKYFKLTRKNPTQFFMLAVSWLKVMGGVGRGKK